MLDSAKLLYFESKIRYEFQNTQLLLEALSHPSLKAVNSMIYQNYEKLELLGDAVLNLVVTEQLIKIFPNKLEGALAKLKAYLVSKEVLYQVAISLELPAMLLMSQGEEKIGGRKNINNIENAMEALLAAIYLDSNLYTIRPLINTWWEAYYTKSPAILFDPKSLLQEWTQHHSIPLPLYNIIASTNQDHCPNFKVAVTIQGISTQYGEGRTRKDAEKAAARQVLALIDLA